MRTKAPVAVTGGLVEVDAATKVLIQWDYSDASEQIRKLFSQAKSAAWDPETDIDWSIPVEFGSPSTGVLGDTLASDRLGYLDSGVTRDEVRWHMQAWMLSQFLHGEQGALLAAARLVETVPEVDWKLCAAAQALDEAKHVEVFKRYLFGKLGEVYPVNREFESLLLDIVGDRRWDMIYLGMQVLVEGAALGSFTTGRTLYFDPLSQQIVDLVLRDEARHVAFGMLALEEVSQSWTAPERAERLEFIREAVHHLNRRFRVDDVHERLGLGPADDAFEGFIDVFRKRSMRKIPPLLQRLGLWNDDLAAQFGRRP